MQLLESHAFPAQTSQQLGRLIPRAPLQAATAATGSAIKGTLDLWRAAHALLVLRQIIALPDHLNKINVQQDISALTLLPKRNVQLVLSVQQVVLQLQHVLLAAIVFLDHPLLLPVHPTQTALQAPRVLLLAQL